MRLMGMLMRNQIDGLDPLSGRPNFHPLRPFPGMDFARRQPAGYEDEVMGQPWPPLWGPSNGRSSNNSSRNSGSPGEVFHSRLLGRSSASSSGANSNGNSNSSSGRKNGRGSHGCNKINPLAGRTEEDFSERLRNAFAPTALTDSLDALRDLAQIEEVAENGTLPEPKWGEKAHYSIYDEDEVLGRPMDPLAAENEALFFRLASLGEEMHENDDEDLDEEEGLAAHLRIDEIIFAPDMVLDFRREPSLRMMPAHVMLGRPSASASSSSSSSSAARQSRSEPRQLRAIKRCVHEHTVTCDLQDSCPICMERLSTGEVAWRLPCFHLLHSSCGQQYFSRRHVQPVCPFCRCDARRHPQLDRLD